MARKKDNSLDFYATEPKAIQDFLTLTDIQLDNKVWECACGIGSISGVLKENKHDVYSTDIVNRGYNDATFDFLQCTEKFDGDIMTNPPYFYLDSFIDKGLELTKRRLLLLVPLTFIQAACRSKLIEQYKCTIYIYLRRIDIAKDGLFELYHNKNVVKYCWLVFDKESDNKDIRIKYIKNNINPLKIKTMPKKIDLKSLKATFDEKATEKEKQSYEAKDSEEKKNEYLKKWNRNNKNETSDTDVDISQNNKKTTSVELFLEAAKKITTKKKFTLQEIKDIEEKIKAISTKINELRSEAEKEAEANHIAELRKKVNDAKAAKEKAAAEEAEAEAELNKLGAPLEVQEAEKTEQ